MMYWLLIEESSLTSLRAFFLSFSGALSSEIYFASGVYLFESDFGGIPLPHCEVHRGEAATPQDLEDAIVLDPFHSVFLFLDII